MCQVVKLTTEITLTRWYSKRWLLVQALVLAIVVFILNIGSSGPMIQPDEGSYLANAAAIAGYPNDMASSYHAGYSLFLAPIFWVTASPSSIWVGVKFVNCLLYAFMVFLLALVANLLFPKSSPKERLASVLLTAIYPMWVIMAGYAFAQIAFVLSHLIVFFVLVLAVQTGSEFQTGSQNLQSDTDTRRHLVLGFSFFLGLMTGFTYWAHPMGISVIVAAALAILYWCRTARNYYPLLIWFLALALSLVFYKVFFVPWLHDKMTISGLPPRYHYPSISKLLSLFHGWDTLRNMLALLGGHVLYLLLGTVGLICVAATILMQWLRGKHDNLEMIALYRVAAIFLLGSLIASLGLSVMALSQKPQRLDHWIYGRYIEGVLAPVLLVGAMTPRWRIGLWAVPSAVVFGVLLRSGLGPYLHTAPFNVPTFWQEFFIRHCGLGVWILGGVAIIACVHNLPKRYAIIGVALFFAFNITLQIRYHAAASKGAVTRSIASSVVRQLFNPGTCIGYDFAGQDTYEKIVYWYDLWFPLYDYLVKRADYSTWKHSCEGALFSYDKRLLQDDEVVPIALTPRGGPVLYIRKEHYPLVDHDFYPIKVHPLQPHMLRILADGWHDIERSHVWSKETATLKLPVPEHCRPNGCEVELIFSVYGATHDRPMDVLVGRSVGGKIEPIKSLRVITANDEKVSIRLSDPVVETVIIEVPQATSPKLLTGSRDPRVLGIALKEIRLK